MCPLEKKGSILLYHQNSWKREIEFAISAYTSNLQNLHAMTMCADFLRSMSIFRLIYFDAVCTFCLKDKGSRYSTKKNSETSLVKRFLSSNLQRSCCPSLLSLYAMYHMILFVLLCIFDAYTRILYIICR